MKGGDIVDKPTYTHLRSEMETLRSELSSKIIERDNLNFIVSRNLNAKYMTTIGVYEYRVYERYCAIMRILRKIAIIRGQLNRHEAVVIPLVEKMLDKEFADAGGRLEEFRRELKAAREISRADFLSDEENRRCKALYFAIVSRLHPDLNPDTSDEEQELFDSAVDAYEAGSREKLERIAKRLDDLAPPQPIVTYERLKEIRDKLAHRLRAVSDEIEGIWDSYPCNQKELLLDDAKIKEKTDELQDIIRRYDIIYKNAERQLQELLGEPTDEEKATE